MNQRKITELLTRAFAETMFVGNRAEQVAEHAAMRLVEHDKCAKLTEVLTMFPVRVCFDPRAAVVPEIHRAQPSLVLQVGYNLKPPIHDLTINLDGFSGVFSFNRAPFACSVPWSAVFALQNEKREMIAMWPSSIPAELIQPPKPEAPAKRHLTLVPEKP